MVSASRRDVLRYGLSAVLAPGIVAAASGVPSAGAAPTRLIDFAERLVSPEQIKAADLTARWSTSPNCGPVRHSTSSR